MPSTTPPVAASSNQIRRMPSSTIDAGYVICTAPSTPVAEPTGIAMYKVSLAPGCRTRVPLTTSPANAAATAGSAAKFSGVVASRRALMSVSAYALPSRSTITTRPPELRS